MLLTIDIGNTAASFALFRGKRIVQNYVLEQNLNQAVYSKKLKSILNLLKKKGSIESVIICSVVPKISKRIEKAARTELKTSVRVIGRDIKVPIKNKYKKPSSVGQDRLVVAYAAKELYGTPVIIVDFGTAITFDVVSKSGSYEGGIIVPGIRLTAEALFAKTALLPRIEKIRVPKFLIGKDTKESILSGIFNGYGAMSCGLIESISKKIKGTPKVIVTGGYTGLMRKYIAKRIDKIDPDLVFEGMYLLNKIQH